MGRGCGDEELNNTGMLSNLGYTDTSQSREELKLHFIEMDLVSIGSDNGLSLDSITPLPKPMLTIMLK